jgi:hypothetical protein
VARGGVADVAVDTGSGPSVVWLVFLFFLIFFSSFFSSASLERRGEKRLGEGKSRSKDFVKEHSRGVALHPSPLARKG